MHNVTAGFCADGKNIMVMALEWLSFIHLRISSLEKLHFVVIETLLEIKRSIVYFKRQ